ncbi:SpoIIE family protein phosphatase [Bythopirellula goksoeyrii]|uniref:Phosphoserine phosphatase RsbU n=1 Tax=Bythopirellula goksoeyrii TaxID=1400387 RepID=A0A5B9Q524_9BACT|nr:SpoIIE family protein phosphatase [Bythopirellula goksoeyrii]QEG32840.1 Phosphoserine phosphatase RsbU [Bythopirellula goksoeyrii]
MAGLKIVQGGEIGRVYDLDEGEHWVMGRSPECDLVLDVAAVSRRHIILTKENGHIFVKDLGSRNGTYINNVRVEDRGELKNGDQMLICDILFVFEDGSPSKSLGGAGPTNSSLLQTLAEESEEDPNATSEIMATLDVSKGSASVWNLSARPETQLQALVEISNNLGSTLTVKEILPKILDSLFKIFVQADRGFIVMRPQPTAPLVAVASKARKTSDEENMRFSRTIVRQAMEGKRAILSADASSDERFGMAESIADFQIRSLICAPMISSAGESLGVVQIDTNNQRSRFTDQDLQLLAGIANQASIALDNARLHQEAMSQMALQRDMEAAKLMQRALLPHHSPEVTGYHFFAYYESAFQVGGDYYDYVSLPDNRFAVVLGDVAGKGVPAAILMAKLSSDVRLWLAIEPDPAKALGKINSIFSGYGWDDRFVTMVVAVVDPATNKLILVNAGHMPPILRNAKGEILEIGGEEAGLPVGVIDDFEFEAYERVLEPGDFVTIYTDGFSEAMNSERDLYGVERMIELISDKTIINTDLGNRLLDDVRGFAGDYPQSDDMCLVCIGRD